MREHGAMPFQRRKEHVAYQADVIGWRGSVVSNLSYLRMPFFIIIRLLVVFESSRENGVVIRAPRKHHQGMARN